MPVVPTPEYHMVLSYIMLVGGLVVSALCLVVLIVLGRQGRRGLILLGPTGLAVIAVGLSASGAVHLLGLAWGMDTADLALAVQVGTTAFALALLTIGALRYWHRASVR